MSTYSVLCFHGQDLPEDYRALVYSRWLRGLRHGNDYFKLIDPKAYYPAYHRFISSILERPTTQVRIAVLTEDKDVALGFSVSRETILDFVHVHKDQRRIGVAKTLVPPGIKTITHLTKTGLTIWGTSYGNWKFDPFA